jgi:hypothetical protein
VSAVEQQFEAMTIGMVFDKAFRLYTQNFPLMFGITAALNIPVLVISLLPELFSLSRSSFAVGIATLLYSLVSLLAVFVIYPLATGAVTKAVSDKYLGSNVTIGEALSEAWGSVGTLLLTQWVAGLIAILGLFLLIVPGILWMLSYSLIAPVVIIEATDRKQRKVYSLTGDYSRTVPVLMDRADIRRRSWDLVKGSRGKVFVVFALIFIMNVLLSGGGSWVISLIFSPSSVLRPTVETTLNNVINMFVSPLQTIAITLLYYDFRIRKEGFDLEMLSQAMGGPAIEA